MTEFSGAGDKIDFDGNTFLLEFENNESVYRSRLEIFQFKTDDKIIDFISLLGSNMIPYTFAVGDKYTYFLSSHYKFIENDKIDEGILLNATTDKLDPFLYHHGKCGVDSFETIEHSQIQTFYPHNEKDVEDEEDEDLIESNFCNGNKEVVKIFHQQCVTCYEKASVYAFRKCGHQCNCEDCYQSRDVIDLLKYVVCRT